MKNLHILAFLWFCMMLYKVYTGDDYQPSLIVFNVYIVGIFIVQELKTR